MKRDLPAQVRQKDKLKGTLRLSLSHCHTPRPTGPYPTQVNPPA